MADAKAATDFVIKQEDESLRGTITNTSSDLGGFTRYGLSVKWHPELEAAGFFDASMPSATAYPMAEAAYERVYEGPLMLDQITDQGIATALLSFCVNEGNFAGVKMLQESAQGLGATITADGEMGPATLAAINACGPARLLSFYCDDNAAHYRRIATANPSQEKFLAGWISRVNACRTLSV